MIKKTAAALAAAALIIGALIIFLPKDLNKTAPSDEYKGLTVGVTSLSGNVSPFFEAEEGDLEVRKVALSPMVCTREDTQITASDSEACVCEDFRIFYADSSFKETDSYSDGGYTAIEYVLKPYVTFSNGEALTVRDALFSVYTLLDPLSEGSKAPFATIAGLDDYLSGSAGTSENMAKARAILSNDVGASPADGDGYTASEAADMREILEKNGEIYAERIIDFVIGKYCTEDKTSSLIFSGVTPDDVRGSRALTNAYALMMWNYGTFLYAYTPDEAGQYVGSTDADGAIVYKTTYDDAMSDENYVTYVRDDEYGDYYYDYTTSSYLPIAEDDGTVFFRYRRVLSDGYVRISRSSLAGFRDIEGNTFSLDENSFPSASHFFDLMKDSYTADGVFDYASMEKIESADDFRFSEESVKEFAVRHASNVEVTAISGIVPGETVSSDGTKRETLTLYFEGNDYVAAAGANFYVVSCSDSLSGFTPPEGCRMNDAGAPVACREFFDHLKKSADRPVSASAFAADGFDGDRKEVRLNRYSSFNLIDGNITYPKIDRITFRAVEGDDAVELLNSGEIMISLAPVAKSSVEKAKDNVEAIYYPNASYKYLLINPAYYKNINTRRAIMSLIDTSIMEEAGTSRLSRCVPSYFDSYAGNTESLFDSTGMRAANLFEIAGFKLNDDGELIDPSTKEKARFTFCMLPEEEGGNAGQAIGRAIEILRGLGADGEIVYDSDLLARIYSDEDVPIFVSAWNLGQAPSLYERYGYSSGSAAVKGCGIEKLFTVGQMDNVGKITYKDLAGDAKYTTQSDAVECLDEAIKAGDSSIDRTKRNASYVTAEQIITNLSFELPLCEYNNVCLVRRDLADAATLFASPSAAKGPLSEIWNVSFVEPETDSSADESADGSAAENSENETSAE